jgi:ribosome-associated toxin RatA of RatAB toxin-antitoxin module
VKTLSRSAIVDRSAGALYALVENIESYPQFLPHCRRALVHWREPGRTRASVELALGRIALAFTTQNENRPGSAIDMRLIEGPFRHFEAQWRFEPLGEDAAKMSFRMQYEFRNALAARTLGPLLEKVADRMVEAFYRRAKGGPPA